MHKRIGNNDEKKKENEKGKEQKSIPNENKNKFQWRNFLSFFLFLLSLSLVLLIRLKKNNNKSEEANSVNILTIKNCEINFNTFSHEIKEKMGEMLKIHEKANIRNVDNILHSTNVISV